VQHDTGETHGEAISKDRSKKDIIISREDKKTTRSVEELENSKTYLPGGIRMVVRIHKGKKLRGLTWKKGRVEGTHVLGGKHHKFFREKMM